MHPLYLIAAVDQKGGIGKAGKLPWNLKKDLAFFHKVTTKTDNFERENIVIMGHKTWDSIPQANRPLKGRKNIVLTRLKDLKAEGATVFHSLKDALNCADELIESIYVIGGGKVFEEAVRLSGLRGIYFTRIKGDFKCDTFFPKIPRGFQAEHLENGEENGIKFEFLFYKKP